MAKRRSGKGNRRPRTRKRTVPAKSAKTKSLRKPRRQRPAPPLPMHPRKRIARRTAEVVARPAPRPKTRRPRTIYDRDLDRNPANFQPLTPISFLERAALVFPDRPAIVHGNRTYNYAQFY